MEQKHSVEGTGIWGWGKELAGLGWRVYPHPQGFLEEMAFLAVGISSRRGFREHLTFLSLGTVEWAGKAGEKCLLRDGGLVTNFSTVFSMAASF